jgi:hypothetical protein
VRVPRTRARRTIEVTCAAFFPAGRTFDCIAQVHGVDGSVLSQRRVKHFSVGRPAIVKLRLNARGRRLLSSGGPAIVAVFLQSRSDNVIVGESIPITLPGR